LATHQAANGTPAYFHLITSGNNSVPAKSGNSNTTLIGFAATTAAPYYNQATGLGSVDANVLVSHWTDLLPATSTVLTVSPSPSASGQNVTLTATVTGATPTGTVQFADGAASLGAPVALSGGAATLVTGALAAGGHSLSATYSGDTGNLRSISPVWQQAVLSATAVNVSATPATIAAGQAVSFTATVSGAAPTGTVQFKDGASSLGGAVTLSAAAATLSTNALVTAGSHSITAAYSGDAGNVASTSAPLAEIVTQATSTVSIAASALSVIAGQSVTFTATVSGMAPTGSVQFTDAGTSLGTAVALNGGTATLSTSILSVGSHSIAATYSGDANNYGSASVVITETISAVGSPTAGDADVPTLPEWATLLLGMLLMSAIWRRAGGAVAPRAAQGLRPATAGWKARVPR
jgi:hypothetical protein